MERTQTAAGTAILDRVGGGGAGRPELGSAATGQPGAAGASWELVGDIGLGQVSDGKADGGQVMPGPGVQVRQGGAQDAARIRDFVIGLSPRSRFQRFFASVSPPSSSLLRGLCGASGADVLLATHRDAVVGHCMAADRTEADGARVSEVGLVVTDRWQDRGIGTALLDLAVQRAAGRGAQQLVMDVMPSNDRMREIIAHRWPTARRELHRDGVTFRAELAAARPAGSPASAASTEGA